MVYEKIKVSLNDGIAVICLADPATMNAAGLDTMAELRAAFAAFARPQPGMATMRRERSIFRSR